MKTVIIIPARYNSSRFPGKPLARIRGFPMIERVYYIAATAAPSARIIVATDDIRISDFVNSFSGESIITPSYLRNGTERVAFALNTIAEQYDFVVNLQGDAVLTPPWVINSLLLEAKDPQIEMVTPASLFSDISLCKFLEAKQSGQVGGTTVVFNKYNDALYFSKSIIPYNRNEQTSRSVWRHVGVYGYRPDILKKLTSLPPGPLEEAEGLEQLRALENGIKIRVVPVDYRGRTHWGVDTIEDLLHCEYLIECEGEFIDRFRI